MNRFKRTIPFALVVFANSMTLLSAGVDGDFWQYWTSPLFILLAYIIGLFNGEN